MQLMPMRVGGSAAASYRLTPKQQVVATGDDSLVMTRRRHPRTRARSIGQPAVCLTNSR